MLRSQASVRNQHSQHNKAPRYRQHTLLHYIRKSRTGLRVGCSLRQSLEVANNLFWHGTRAGPFWINHGLRCWITSRVILQSWKRNGLRISVCASENWYAVDFRHLSTWCFRVLVYAFPNIGCNYRQSFQAIYKLVNEVLTRQKISLIRRFSQKTQWHIQKILSCYGTGSRVLRLKDFHSVSKGSAPIKKGCRV